MVKKTPGTAVLASPDTIRPLSAGTTIHRIHSSSRGASDFNPCMGGNSRFAPISDSVGSCIPSMYAGSTFAAACYETNFHDVGVGHPRTVLASVVKRSAHSTIVLKRELKMMHIGGPELRAHGTTENFVLYSSATQYRFTKQWAENIAQNNADIMGISWISKQCNPDYCFLFFGDRVQPVDFDLDKTRDGATDHSYLSDVGDAGRRSGISLVV